MVEAGQPAPDFTLSDQHGQPVTLSQFRGTPVVLYFYPKDDTSGCTAEACGFRDTHPKFTKISAMVIGISRDSVASHDKFKKKYQLPFTLGADTEGKVTDAYGVWVEKSMYGRKYMGIERTTFVIGKDRQIAMVWNKVKVPGHAATVLAAVKAL